MRAAAAGAFVLAGCIAGPAQAAFERLALNPPAAALGGVLAVSPDPVFGNPAVLGDDSLERWRLGAWVARPFGLAELTEAQIWAHRGLQWGAIGLGLRRFGSWDYAEKEIRISGSWTVTPSVALGLDLRGLYVGVADRHRRAPTLDAAFRLRPESGTEIGGFLEGVLGTIPGDPEGRLRKSALGARRRLSATLSVYLEAQRREDRSVSGVLGISWNPLRILTLRAGVRESPASVSWGFGILAGGFVVTGSVTHTDLLDRTVRIGFRTAVQRPVREAQF